MQQHQIDTYLDKIESEIISKFLTRYAIQSEVDKIGNEFTTLDFCSYFRIVQPESSGQHGDEYETGGIVGSKDKDDPITGPGKPTYQNSNRRQRRD